MPLDTGLRRRVIDETVKFFECHVFEGADVADVAVVRVRVEQVSVWDQAAIEGK